MSIQYLRRPWLTRLKEWWQLRNTDFSLSSEFSQGFMNRAGVSELKRIMFGHNPLGFEMKIKHIVDSPLKVQLFQKPIREAILSGEFESKEWDRHKSFDIRYCLSEGRILASSYELGGFRTAWNEKEDLIICVAYEGSELRYVYFWYDHHRGTQITLEYRNGKLCSFKCDISFRTMAYSSQFMCEFFDSPEQYRENLIYMSEILARCAKLIKEKTDSVVGDMGSHEPKYPEKNSAEAAEDASIGEE